MKSFHFPLTIPACPFSLKTYPKYLKHSQHSSGSLYILWRKFGTGTKFPQRNEIWEEFVVANVGQEWWVGIIEGYLWKDEERKKLFGMKLYTERKCSWGQRNSRSPLKGKKRVVKCEQ